MEGKEREVITKKSPARPGTVTQETAGEKGSVSFRQQGENMFIPKNHSEPNTELVRDRSNKNIKRQYKDA